MSTMPRDPFITAQLARRARNTVAQTILSISLAPRFDAPPATVGTLVDLLEPLNELAHGAWSKS